MTTTNFRPGTRVQIQDRDRTPANYPVAVIVRGPIRGEMVRYDGTAEVGYVVRYDNGCEVWKPEYDVLAVRPAL